MIVSIILFVFVWVFEALEELTIHKPERFDKWPKPKRKLFFYDSSLSWAYKYKEYRIPHTRIIEIIDDSPAFPGSKTWLVWLTDAYHLFKMIKIVLLCLSITFLIGTWWWYFILHGIYFVIFELTYRKL
jgi:hypothetical protein